MFNFFCESTNSNYRKKAATAIMVITRTEGVFVLEGLIVLVITRTEGAFVLE